MSYPIDTDQEIETEQLVLPFYHPLEQVTGWQFGVPFRGPELRPTEHSIIMFAHEHGSDADERQWSKLSSLSPHMEAPADRPPAPFWAWVPFRRSDGSIEYARTVAPEKGEGSLPLSQMEDYDIEAILTPEGRVRADRRRTPIDCPFPIEHSGEDDARILLNVGPFEFGLMSVQDGFVQAIYPFRDAKANDLWSSHLIRMAVVESRQPGAFELSALRAGPEA